VHKLAQKRWPEVASRSRIAPRNQPFGGGKPQDGTQAPLFHHHGMNGVSWILFGAVPRFRRSKGIGKTQHEK
jgi:hypothetical protein